MTATLSLAQRELKRFYRQRSRIIGSLATPVVFWLLLGTGLSAAFPTAREEGGGNFSQFFFPANLIMTLLFTAVFSSISIIEDRHQGFLQGVLVSPVSSFGLVGGKVFGGTTIALFQGLLFLCLAPLANFHLSVSGLTQVILAMAAMGFTMTSVSFMFAWKIDSVQGFHSIMNLVLFPMWLLSGAFFPISNTPKWLQGIMYLNPLTYGVSALYHGLYEQPDVPVSFGAGVLTCFVFGVLFYVASMKLVSKRGTSHGNE